MIENKDLIRSLNMALDQIDRFVNTFESIDIRVLQKKPASDKWSVIECLEHLNHTTEQYKERVSTGLSRAKSEENSAYKPSRFGNMTVDNTRPTPQGEIAKPMRTFKILDPGKIGPQSDAIGLFKENQKLIRQWLIEASGKNLGSVKIPTLIPIFRLKLGDILRFLIAHQERHILQASRALNAVK